MVMNNLVVMEAEQLEALLTKTVLPLQNQINNLERLLKPHQVEFDDYEKGFEVAMEITGKKKSTICRMVKSNEIPSIKKGGDRYFSRTELKLWLVKGRRKILTEMV